MKTHPKTRSTVKRNIKREATRDVFAELAEGLAALADARAGKRILRSRYVEFKAKASNDPRNAS
ncbi:MAG: hypothetical protein E6H66_07205 [Betaproteobacteria bacterium]|nr:MAG: hypothetical protein E6H64_17825 [Betaproteobacteria bacterium]TMH35618.1 MAG: hypothetical protein E6H66_07205 [Betaproteobacteria bacterium]